MEPSCPTQPGSSSCLTQPAQQRASPVPSELTGVGARGAPLPRDRRPGPGHHAACMEPQRHLVAAPSMSGRSQVGCGPHTGEPAGWPGCGVCEDAARPAEPAPEAPTPPGRPLASRRLLDGAGHLGSFCSGTGGPGVGQGGEEVSCWVPVGPGAQEGCRSPTPSCRADRKLSFLVPVAVVGAPLVCWSHVGVSAGTASRCVCIHSTCWGPGWTEPVRWLPECPA